MQLCIFKDKCRCGKSISLVNKSIIECGKPPQSSELFIILCYPTNKRQMPAVGGNTIFSVDSKEGRVSGAMWHTA